ncbi:MAG: hypothetical protein OXC40_04570, partial [Proteobacteria bacterium]|nr:hypothetical protein [Pseudomonadota bacterium]
QSSPPPPSSSTLNRWLKQRQLLVSQKAFSLVELIITLGLFVPVLTLGSQTLCDTVLSGICGSDGSSLAERTHALHMVRHKHFSVHFLDVMKRSAVSMNYTKLFVKYGEDCMNIDNGPCFFTLDKDGARDSFDATTLVKEPRGEGIHFFSDRVLSTKPTTDNVYIRKKYSEGEFFVPKKARYENAVLSSAEKRYFAGWSLKKPGKQNPFYVMSAPKLKLESFVIDGLSGRTKDTTPANNYSALILPRSLSEFEGHKNISSYENRYYLAYFSLVPEAHFVMKIEKLESCNQIPGDDNNKAITPNCKNALDAVTTLSDPVDQDKNEKTPQQIRYESHVNHYLAKLTQCGTRGDGCSKFFKDFPKPINRTGLFDAAMNDFNFFFVDKFNVKMESRVRDFMRQVPSQNPHFFINFASMTSDGDENSGQAEVIIYPLQFYRYYLESEGDTKNLVMESDKEIVSNPDPNNPQNSPSTSLHKKIMIRGLNNEARIVFARKLGTTQFSAFIFDHDKKSAPPTTGSP